MRKLGYAISAIATITISTVAGSSQMLATATPSVVDSGNTFSPTHLLPSTRAPEWLAQSNYWSDCRKVTQNYTQFYTTFPGSGGGVGTGILNSGDRIRLLDEGRTYQGSDGRFYYRVSSPYASQNPTIGYISVSSSLSRCGPAARW